MVYITSVSSIHSENNLQVYELSHVGDEDRYRPKDFINDI